MVAAIAGAALRVMQGGFEVADAEVEHMQRAEQSAFG